MWFLVFFTAFLVSACLPLVDQAIKENAIRKFACYGATATFGIIALALWCRYYKKLEFASQRTLTRLFCSTIFFTIVAIGVGVRFVMVEKSPILIDIAFIFALLCVWHAAALWKFRGYAGYE